MLKFLPLASSSAGNCYLLSGGGAEKPLLIDAGIPFKAIQKGIGFQTHRLTACLVSHAHLDHIKAVPDLVYHGVDCYASEGTWTQFDDNSRRIEPRDYRYKTLEAMKAVQIGEWKVLPFDAQHDCPGTLGFLIGSPAGDKALYLTDSAYSKYKFEGLTHIFVECNWSREILTRNHRDEFIDNRRFARIQRTHMSLERLTQMLKANDLSRVQEIHLLHLSAQNSHEAEFKKAVAAATGKPVFIAAE